MGKPIIIRYDDEKRTIYGAGDEYAYLATGRDTDGGYFMMHAVVPPGGGPPPHTQTREEEGFYVLEGRVTFWIEGERKETEAGAFVHVPRGVAHNFRNESDQNARMLIWFTPAGIEEMFTRMAADPDRYAEIAKEYGVEFVGAEPDRF